MAERDDELGEDERIGDGGDLGEVVGGYGLEPGPRERDHGGAQAFALAIFEALGIVLAGEVALLLVVLDHPALEAPPELGRQRLQDDVSVGWARTDSTASCGSWNDLGPVEASLVVATHCFVEQR